MFLPYFAYSKLLQTKAFTHRCFTHRRCYTGACTHRSFYTQTRFRRDALTQTLFTHRRFYTQTALYTQTLSHTDAFTRRFCTEASTDKNLYTYKFLHANVYSNYTIILSDSLFHDSYFNCILH